MDDARQHPRLTPLAALNSRVCMVSAGRRSRLHMTNAILLTFARFRQHMIPIEAEPFESRLKGRQVGDFLALRAAKLLTCRYNSRR